MDGTLLDFSGLDLVNYQTLIDFKFSTKTTVDQIRKISSLTTNFLGLGKERTFLGIYKHLYKELRSIRHQLDN